MIRMATIANYLADNGHEVSMFMPENSKIVQKLGIEPKFNTIVMPGLTEEYITKN